MLQKYLLTLSLLETLKWVLRQTVSETQMKFSSVSALFDMIKTNFMD